MDPQVGDQSNQQSQNPAPQSAMPVGAGAPNPEVSSSDGALPSTPQPPQNQEVVQAAEADGSASVPVGADGSAVGGTPSDGKNVQKPAPEAKSQRFSFANTQRGGKRKREIIRAEDRQVKLASHLGDMIVPFVSVGVLLLLIIFVFLPFGTQIVETREGTKEILTEIERNEKKIEKLSSIDLNLLEDRLKDVTLVVRDEMDVAELAMEVEEMATGREVEPTSAAVSNQEDVVSDSSQVENSWVPEYADTISGPFNYRGSFESITDFLLALRLESRTILSMGEINLSRVREDEVFTGDWIASLSITGYTTDPETETTISAPVITDIDQEILDEILDRAEKYRQGDEPAEDTDVETDSTE